MTRQIEDAVASVEKLSNIYSYSYEGLSVISLEYNYSADVDQAMQEVQRKVNGIMLNLPREIGTPSSRNSPLMKCPCSRPESRAISLPGTSPSS